MKAGHLQQEKGRKSTTGRRQEMYNRKKAGNVQQEEGRKSTLGPFLQPSTRLEDLPTFGSLKRMNVIM